jgi:predicted RNA-binding protein with PUA-like domain
MQKGDLAFFYHSVDEKRIVGIVEIIREHHPDPTASANDPWVAVDVRAATALPRPVTLAQIRADSRLKNMALLKYSRLSVQPVTPAEWKMIRAMAGLPS